MLRSDFPLPKTVLDRERADSNVEWLAAKVGEHLAELLATTWKMFPTVAFRCRSRDGIGDAVRHTVRLATTPTDDYRKGVRLTKAITPFYRLARPGNQYWRTVWARARPAVGSPISLDRACA